MTNEEILEKQVEALEKLLQLRAVVIEELEAKVRRLEAEKFTLTPGVVNIPWINPLQPQWAPANPLMPQSPSQWTITGNTCPDGTLHDYPSHWSGTMAPSCSKCGAGQYSIPVTSGHIAPITNTTGLAQTINSDDQSNVYTISNNIK